MEPITATYAQENSDWTITVAGLGRQLTARAPGIIAARDRADQLVEKLAGEQSGRTVVHLLRGSALEFTAAYMQARLARPKLDAEPAAAEKPSAPAKGANGSRTAAKAPAKSSGGKRRARTTPANRSAKADAKPSAPPAGGKVADVNGALEGDAAANETPAVKA